MKNKIFLATTAIDKAWDKKSDNILLLGNWCKLSSNKKVYKNYKFKILEYIWTDEKEIDKGIEYCEDIYQKVLEKLTLLLNKYHGISQKSRYWNTLLKPWLFPYIQIIYDRYRHLELASVDEDLYTFTIKEEEYQYINTPTTFSHNVVNSDEYNLQLYSQIIKFMNIEHKDIEYKMNKIETSIIMKSTLKERVFRNILKLLNKIFNKNSILIVNPYFKNSGLKKIIYLSVKSKFLFLFDDFRYDISVKSKINTTARKNIFISEKNNNQFMNLIFNTLVYNFPIIYLEGYKKFHNCVHKLPIKNLNNIYSANALHGNEIFKFYIAKNRNRLKLLYGQHGGNIGIDKKNIPEIIERSVCDIYFTFGWKEQNTRVLSHANQGIVYSNANNIIFIMTAMPRYFYRFVYQEDSTKMLTYIENSKTFLSQLKNINYLTIRMYMQDYKWNIKERLLEVNKNLKFDNTTSYYKQISNSKLVIFDHMHTGYLETLSSNIPTVIIIPKNIYYFRDSAKAYIQMLKDVKILFEDSIEASKFVDNIYDDIDKWWLSEEVQKVREEFCYNYARTSDNWADEWVKEFTKVLEE